ncbi:GNAT family N-acetyltransferase [Shewanella sp.]|uniref:GNAT family N-acetyltransferase n=1 Tax=Shewanella sp. TaxID=50422 RepID=UPI003A973545
MTHALISTPRLTLRQMLAQDWPLFLRLNRDPEVNRFIRDIESEDILQQKFSARCFCEDFFAGDWLSLTIMYGDDAVGLMGICCIDNELLQAEVGYLIAPEYCGQGIATEALTALSQWALTQYQLHKIVGRCVDGNMASARVLTKSGFQLEGILRHNHRIGGEWLDERFYGLLAP